MSTELQVHRVANRTARSHMIARGVHVRARRGSLAHQTLYRGLEGVACETSEGDGITEPEDSCAVMIVIILSLLAFTIRHREMLRFIQVQIYAQL